MPIRIIDGVSPILEAAAFVLYPNPATQKATIVFSDILPAGHQLLISNIAGQLVETIIVKDDRLIYR